MRFSVFWSKTLSKTGESPTFDTNISSNTMLHMDKTPCKHPTGSNSLPYYKAIIPFVAMFILHNTLTVRTYMTTGSSVQEDP